jgi:hypothetical protein
MTTPVIDVDKVLAELGAAIEQFRELSERLKATLAADKAEPATPEPVAVHPLAGEVAAMLLRHAAVIDLEGVARCKCGSTAANLEGHRTHTASAIAEFVERRTAEGIAQALHAIRAPEDHFELLPYAATIASNYRAT